MLIVAPPEVLPTTTFGEPSLTSLLCCCCWYSYPIIAAFYAAAVVRSATKYYCHPSCPLDAVSHGLFYWNFLLFCNADVITLPALGLATTYQIYY
ncbi:hypothetical protein TNIN_318021 [Trichonephila inaurata madagascariensis]|uniref:Uncharacterized protein n=1 Tax=Trichonephila inaurata madagascariensis TaxID=2747483 RepID=A0A8X6YTS5_9ARAC|nr:hypothetical protein TNIN_318021 [Trichonephila inaurata madagascariensis]